MRPVILASEKKYAGQVEFIYVETGKKGQNEYLINEYLVQNNMLYIPSYFLLGKNGVVYDKYSGDLTQPQLDLKIDNLIKQFR